MNFFFFLTKIYTTWQKQVRNTAVNLAVKSNPVFLFLSLSILYLIRIYPKYLRSSQHSNDTLYFMEKTWNR